MRAAHLSCPAGISLQHINGIFVRACVNAGWVGDGECRKEGGGLSASPYFCVYIKQPQWSLEG